MSFLCLAMLMTVIDATRHLSVVDRDEEQVGGWKMQIIRKAQKDHVFQFCSWNDNSQETNDICFIESLDLTAMNTSPCRCMLKVVLVVAAVLPSAMGSMTKRSNRNSSTARRASWVACRQMRDGIRWKCFKAML